uniref:Uncharacterized protein n=1 Tax=Parascaris equorum TaxID=6256 RepID=A0A914RC11_PAREQ
MCVVLYGLPASNSSRCEQSLVDDFINYNNRDIRSLDASSNSGISQVPYEPSSQIAEDSIAHENKATTAATQQSLVLVLISCLQHWCRQLFWLTILCVIGCCGDSISQRTRSKTIRHVRRTIRAQYTTRTKNIITIEMQVIHLIW